MDEAPPSPDGSRRRRLRFSGRTGGSSWRLVTPLGFAAAGVLLVTSSINSAGTDLRADRYDDLADLARQETERVQGLRKELDRLDAEIERLSAQVDSNALSSLERRIDALEEPAGLTPVAGPGLTITLQDAPAEAREAAGDQVSNAIVHQQDIQAVVNALWAGGAEAMTLQGQRVVSTTGIKCVGNTVLLHGVTYSPPYVISAIGDVDRMRTRVDQDPYVRAYLRAVDEWQLGWQLSVEDSIEAPAFSGPTEMRYVRLPERTKAS